MSFGRKGLARSETPASATTVPAATDRAVPVLPQLELGRATLAIDDGLLMVLGPEGDPVPPAMVAALAADQPEATIAFDDGRKAPAGRIAEVLAAQARGRLAPAGDGADRWLEVMLGIGPAPVMTSDEELQAEGDGLGGEADQVDRAGEADEEPTLGGDAPAPPDAASATDSEGATEGETGEPSGAPANEPPPGTIPLACRLGIDDLTNVAVVMITGVPAGAVLSAGSDNGDGSWMLSSDQLEGLAITLPGGAPGLLTLEARIVTVDDRDGAMSTVARKVVISPEASNSAAQPTEPGAGFPLDLDAMVREAAGDGSVSAVVVIGLPADAELSAGRFDERIRSWVIAPDELENLRVVPGTCPSGQFELRVTVVIMDRSAGTPSAVTRSLEVGPLPTVDLSARRPAQRVGGVGFFRPLYNRRR